MQSNLVNRKRPEADVLARLGSLLFHEINLNC
jgi:hypothetical protein